MIIYYCEECEDKRPYKQISTHVVREEAPPCEYTFAYCEKCNRPSMFYREDVGTPEGFADDNYYKLFPSDERHIAYHLPEVIRSSYTDAVKCEQAKIFTACVVMVGRTLEAICKEHIPTTKTIFGGLEDMRKSGMISNELFDWAQRLRVLRNAGAHATSTVITRQEASESIDFLQAILETLYHLRPKFKAIEERNKAVPPKA